MWLLLSCGSGGWLAAVALIADSTYFGWILGLAVFKLQPSVCFLPDCCILFLLLPKLQVFNFNFHVHRRPAAWSCSLPFLDFLHHSQFASLLGQPSSASYSNSFSHCLPQPQPPCHRRVNPVWRTFSWKRKASPLTVSLSRDPLSSQKEPGLSVLVILRFIVNKPI